MEIYMIMDTRAINDPDDACVFEVCNTLEEAKGNMKNYGSGNVVVDQELNVLYFDDK